MMFSPRLRFLLSLIACWLATGRALGEEVASLLEQESGVVASSEVAGSQHEHEEAEDDEEEDEESEDDHEDVQFGEQLDMPTEEEMQDLHEKLDANGDGKASLAEVEAYSKAIRALAAQHDVQTLLRDLDMDGDGKLSVSEFLHDFHQDQGRAKRENDSEEMEVKKFRAADEDGDGLLAANEILSVVDPSKKKSVQEVEVADLIRRRDKDSDGHVSLLEFVNGEKAERAARAASGDEDEEAAGAAASFLEVEGHEDVEDMELEKEFHRLDVDKDGKLSFTELQALGEAEDLHLKEDAKELFDELDQDKDGHISQEELQVARENIFESPLVQEWADLGALIEGGDRPMEDEEQDSEDEVEEEEEHQGSSGETEEQLHHEPIVRHDKTAALRAE
mmetsp:Transcript_72491/g.172817  ORF Transcript_72491/g.172817 Transcript_72491/m.172817 type:complete len:392 (-) Transcript_72491:68-1243(-)